MNSQSPGDLVCDGSGDSNGVGSGEFEDNEEGSSVSEVPVKVEGKEKVVGLEVIDGRETDLASLIYRGPFEWDAVVDSDVGRLDEGVDVGKAVDSGEVGESGLISSVSGAGPARAIAGSIVSSSADGCKDITSVQVEHGANIMACSSGAELGQVQVPEVNRSGEGKIYFSVGRNFGVCTSLFVNNIPPLATSSNLKAWFSHFGRVVDVFIPKKRSKVKGFSFAFVRYRLVYEAILACERADDSVFNGHMLEVNISKYPRIVPKSREGVFMEPIAIRKEFGVLPSGDLYSDVVPKQSSGPRVGRTTLSAGFWRNESGASYAQILKSGGGIQGDPARYAEDRLNARAGVTMISPILENEDHLRVLGGNNSEVDDNSNRIHFSCVNVYFNSEWCDNNGDEDHLCALGRNNSVMGEGLESAPEHGSHSVIGDVAELGTASASDVSGCSKEEEEVFSEADRASESLSSEMMGDLSGTITECGLIGSTDKEGDQIIVRTEEESKDQEVVVVEEAPLSAEEKAEITDQARYIIHDALRIGKAMGINITPRDARMIKRFAVFRHFDRKKWKMGFDDKEDELI